MPITSEIQIRPVSRAVFAEVDSVVMRCAYAAQNHFGRLCEEAVYENDVKARLRAMGFRDVHTQVKLQLSHQGFEKAYRLDLVVNGVLYELKATDSLIPEHDAQALNYAALLGLNRVKLINFGAPKVEGKLHGTPFAENDRRQINVDRREWQPQSEACDKLANWCEELVRSIGGYLRSELYEEALVWFCGGADSCIRRLPLSRDDMVLGKHACRLHRDDCAFLVTGFKPGQGLQNYRQQLQLLVGTLPVRAVQWINVHHLDVSFITVQANEASRQRNGGRGIAL